MPYLKNRVMRSNLKRSENKVNNIGLGYTDYTIAVSKQSRLKM
jgi:hypothetical protein